MVMALGTGIGLLFTVQLVQFIKFIGFKNFSVITRLRAILVQFVLMLMAATLLTVAGYTAYKTYIGEDGNRVLQRSSDAPLLQEVKPGAADPFGGDGDKLEDK